MRKLAAALVLAAGLAFPAASASAAPPCWQKLLVDSYDFKIQHTYPAGCYVQAMKRLPEDLRDYSDLLDVLQRALAVVRRAHPHLSARALAALPVPPTARLPKDARPPRGTKAPFAVVAADVAPGGPSTPPLPLLVLGGLGGVLTAAGAAGAVVRRRRNRGA